MQIAGMQSEIKKPKICFISLNAYALLTQKNLGVTGGAEMQQVLLARELSKEGFDISFITFDFGRKGIEKYDNIKIFKIYSTNAPTGARHYYSKLRTIWNALKQANSDIYYCRGFGVNAGIAALFCLLKKKKFILSIAHDMDVDGTRLKKAKVYGSLAFKFGVKRADCVIAQSKYQQELIKKNFSKDTLIIKSMHILPEEVTEKAMPPIVLWVSRMQNWKQPGLFLEIAKAIPTARFLMIGGVSESKEFYEQIKESANKIPNLEFIGFVPYPQINKYFKRASIFVNTSTAEGFPNTFLQAWARYTPVVSLNVDPDGIIVKYKLGFHSRTFEQMVEDVKLLLEDKKLREKMGENGRRYAEKEHDIKTIVKEYEKIFKELINDRRT